MSSSNKLLTGVLNAFGLTATVLACVSGGAMVFGNGIVEYDQWGDIHKASVLGFLGFIVVHLVIQRKVLIARAKMVVRKPGTLLSIYSVLLLSVVVVLATADMAGNGDESRRSNLTQEVDLERDGEDERESRDEDDDLGTTGANWHCISGFTVLSIALYHLCPKWIKRKRNRV
jgi:hypothetical protein